MQNADAVYAFKRAVLGSPDVHQLHGDKGALCTKFLFWAAEQSQGFTRELIIDLGPVEVPAATNGQERFAQAAMHTVHDVSSSNRPTKINQTLAEHGIDMYMLATNVPRADKQDPRHFALCFTKVGKMSEADLKDIGVIQVDMNAVSAILLDV